MKNTALMALAGALTALLASCGGTQQAPAPERAAQANESIVIDGMQYTLAGQPISADAARQLEAQYGRLFLLATPASSGAVLAVFTSQADLDAAKGAQLSAQGICVGRSRTTIYDLTGYGGDSLEIAKGQNFADLSAMLQSGGSTWDNDASSLKAACSAWSSFYTGTNFSGSVLLVKGDVISDLGGWNNIISSIQVTN